MGTGTAIALTLLLSLVGTFLTQTYNSAESQKNRDANKALQEDAQAFSSAEAEKTYEREKEMMQNSHRWEVEDLKASGLNPILAVNSGASSYTAPMASSGLNSNSTAGHLSSNPFADLTKFMLSSAMKENNKPEKPETITNNYTYYNADGDIISHSAGQTHYKYKR